MRPARLAILAAAALSVLALVPALGLPGAWAFCAVAWGLLAAGLGLDLVLAPGRRHLRVELAAPETMYVGEPAEAVITASMSAGGAIPFEAIVDLSEGLGDVDPLRGTLRSTPVELAVPLHARWRGQAAVEAVTVRYAGPLGLLQRTVRVPFDRPVAVVPNVMPARRAALRFLSDRRFQAGLKIEKYRGDGTEFDSLREFVVGDDSRAIHWRASARHRLLLRRQFRAERNHQIVLAVDSGRLMSEPLAAGIPKVDHAVSAALLMAYIGLKSGDRVGLYAFAAAAGLYVEPQGGMAQYHALALLSAGIDYSDAETNYTLGLTTLLQRLRRRSMVVVLTDFVDTVTAELMIENLGRLSRRHVVVLVSLRDPELERLAGDAPETVIRMNRAIVASAYLHERHLVMRRLERLGLYTVDAEPGRMGPELINRYLDIKRREVI